MRRPPNRPITLVLCVILSTSCLGPPTDLDGGGNAGIAMQPTIIPSPANGSALPINRVRMTAVRTADGTVLGESFFDVDPNQASWTLALDVRLPTSPVDVTLTVLLM